MIFRRPPRGDQQPRKPKLQIWEREMILVEVLETIFFKSYIGDVSCSKAELICLLEGSTRKSECSMVVWEMKKTSKSYLSHLLKVVAERFVRLCSQFWFNKISFSSTYLPLILTFLFGWEWRSTRVLKKIKTKLWKLC